MSQFSLISPNMLKTFEACPRKFYYRYVKNISMPVNDEIFEFGKNIHALASYYLRGENIDGMELSLSDKEKKVWSYLKSIKYFDYNVLKTEYSLSVKVGNFFVGGRIDALLQKDNELFILDYKTGSVPKNSTYDYQTMIYMLAVATFFRTINVNFVYIDLKNKKEVIIKCTEQLINDYSERLIKVLSEIYFDDLPPKRKECSCEYSSICY